jgi:hypothetical protein
VIGSALVDPKGPAWVLVEMSGWRIWRAKSSLDLSGAQLLSVEPDEQGVGRPPFPIGAGDTLEVDFTPVGVSIEVSRGVSESRSSRLAD